MKALITGASSGIGRELARLLADKGYDLILVARREDRLRELSKELSSRVGVRILPMDVSDEEACLALYEQTKDESIDLLVNNAGFGVFGEFLEADLDRELNMLDVNVRAVHILMKLFLRDFVARKRGAVLNVASAAAFLPGPLLSSYYAGKAYVLRLTQAVAEELRRSGSPVYVGALCPGPVKTEFDETAGVSFSVPGLSASEVAAYALRQMERGKTVIVPGAQMKLGRFLSRLSPDRLLLATAYRLQKRKNG